MHLRGRSFLQEAEVSRSHKRQNITDERPSSGVGSSAVTFREHFTFEDGFKNSAPGRKDVEYSIPENGGASINTCTDGKCLRRTSTSSPIHLQDQQGMNSSSVMTWFRFQGENSGDLWHSSTIVGGTNYERYFRVLEDGRLSVKFYRTELTSSQKLPNDENIPSCCDGFEQTDWPFNFHRWNTRGPPGNHRQLEN